MDRNAELTDDQKEWAYKIAARLAKQRGSEPNRAISRLALELFNGASGEKIKTYIMTHLKGFSGIPRNFLGRGMGDTNKRFLTAFGDKAYERLIMSMVIKFVDQVVKPGAFRAASLITNDVNVRSTRLVAADEDPVLDVKLEFLIRKLNSYDSDRTYDEIVRALNAGTFCTTVFTGEDGSADEENGDDGNDDDDNDGDDVPKRRSRTSASERKPAKKSRKRAVQSDDNDLELEYMDGIDDKGKEENDTPKSKARKPAPKKKSRKRTGQSDDEPEDMDDGDDEGKEEDDAPTPKTPRKIPPPPKNIATGSRKIAYQQVVESEFDNEVELSEDNNNAGNNKKGINKKRDNDRSNNNAPRGNNDVINLVSPPLSKKPPKPPALKKKSKRQPVARPEPKPKRYLELELSASNEDEPKSEDKEGRGGDKRSVVYDEDGFVVYEGEIE